ncbi:hypothetical protein ACIPRD_10725 [Streptomyces sp. NPDC090108]
MRVLSKDRLEDPGLRQMEDTVADFVSRTTARPHLPRARLPSAAQAMFAA